MNEDQRQIAMVVIAKAAETDRLTDENRRLRNELSEASAAITALRETADGRKMVIVDLERQIAELREEAHYESQRVASLMLSQPKPAPDYITREELSSFMEASFTGQLASDIRTGRFKP